MEKVLNNVQLNLLRQKGIISNEEIALKVGDLLIAENVTSRERRVISEGLIILKESKQLLKG
jgi:hypothetical protein